ncbi:MAG: response regulator [Desulfobacterales bacterium]|nr:response regulator [Desulfobacterales bacterium]
MIRNETVDNASRPRVLVVDDEKRIRDGCNMMLTEEGFFVVTAESGDLGLNMLTREHYDIVLLDLMMPGLSGLEVLEQIGASHPDTVIIVITGYATLEHAIEAMKKGAFDFIPKPFSPEELRVVIKKAMDHIRTLHDIATEKSRMRALVNHLPGGVMATDKEGTIALANPSFLRMIGYRGSDIIGKSISQIVANETFNKMVSQALTMPGNEFAELAEEFSHGSLSKDDEAVLGVQCIPFRDRLGRNLGTVTVLHDITTQKKMEQLKSDFVSMVAHEIQSPMNSVLMQIKLLLKGRMGDVNKEQTQLLERISEKIKGLSALASELLDLAKIEAGLVIQEKEKLEVAELLRDQVAFYDEKAQTKGITLKLDKLPDLSSILGNRYNIEEVLSNLISNAIRYTPEGGNIVVSAHMEEGYVCIQVSDTGFGIPQEEMGRIFDRFYRIKSEKTRFITGTGLGLSIVKSIVEAHNGVIQVESELDRGSTFSVYLPVMTY